MTPVSLLVQRPGTATYVNATPFDLPGMAQDYLMIVHEAVPSYWLAAVMEIRARRQPENHQPQLT